MPWIFAKHRDAFLLVGFGKIFQLLPLFSRKHGISWNLKWSTVGVCSCEMTVNGGISILRILHHCILQAKVCPFFCAKIGARKQKKDVCQRKEMRQIFKFQTCDPHGMKRDSFKTTNGCKYNAAVPKGQIIYIAIKHHFVWFKIQMLCSLFNITLSFLKKNSQGKQLLTFSAFQGKHPWWENNWLVEILGTG